MKCTSCGRELPSDSRFCQYCGCKIEPETANEESVSESAEAKSGKNGLDKKKLKIICLCVVGFLLLFVGTYLGTYAAARQATLSSDFDTAEKLLILPALTEKHDGNLIKYIQAGQLYNQGKYAAGYKRINQLVNEGYELAIENYGVIKEKAYNTAVSLYKKDETNEAKQLFKTLGGYKRSHDYLILLEHNNYQAVLTLLGFENAGDVILEYYPTEFFCGIWKTKGEQYYFRMKENGDTTYTLPWISVENSHYEIVDAVYTLFHNDYSHWENGTPVFKFTIVDTNTVYAYCYKDGNTYTLYKQ